MKTIRAGVTATAEVEVKRSRFLAQLTRAESVDEAREEINRVKGLYPDARHHCSAYIISPEDLNPLMHSSDDGEPAGTAGTPMLEVLRHSELENVVAIVTRYFGGVLLGTGGLVRAYSQATQAVINAAPIVTMQQIVLFEASFALEHAGKIAGALRNAGWAVLNEDWGQQLSITVGAPVERQADLESFASAQTGTGVKFAARGTQLVAVDNTGVAT